MYFFRGILKINLHSPNRRLYLCSKFLKYIDMSKSKKSKEHLEERKTDDLMVNLLLPDRDIWKSWVDIEKLSLPELENLIRALGAGMGLGGLSTINISKIKDLLYKRKRLLDSTFLCTDDLEELQWRVFKLQWLAQLIKDRATTVREQGNQIYTQMRKLWQEGNNKLFCGFCVEVWLKIHYFGVHLGPGARFDECWENTEKFWMEKLLNGVDEYYYWENLIYDSERICTDSKMYKGNKPFSMSNYPFKKTKGRSKKGWFFDEFPDLRNLPFSQELRNLPFSREFNKLLESYYALEDIIGISDVLSEVKVTWYGKDDNYPDNF